MYDIRDIIVRQEQYLDLRREAERERLARLVKAQRVSRLHRSLAYLGRCLVAWGARLEKRYGASPSNRLSSCAGVGCFPKLSQIITKYEKNP